jgi:hypothetical protein
MFDAATLREELTAIEDKLKQNPRNSELLNRYMLYARKLRQKEFEDNGYVAARSSVTGY